MLLAKQARRHMAVLTATIGLLPRSAAEGLQKVAGARLAVAACMSAVSMMSACGEQEQIRSYRVPKEPYLAAAALVAAAPAEHTEQAHDPALAWDLPQGWTQQAGGASMRYATLTRGGEEAGLTVTVTKLPPQAESLLANVNRWRGQMGLSDIGQDDLSGLTRPLKTQALPGTLVDLMGPGTDEAAAGERMLSAIYQTPGSTWFFKARGSQADLADAEPELLALFRSVRISQDHVHDHTPSLARDQATQAPPDDPHSTQATGSDGLLSVGPLRYRVPEGWRLDPQPRPARLATLRFGQGDAVGELAITRFPGDVGGELANVNRWRGQLGLFSVANLEEQDTRATRISGLDAKVYRFIGPGDAATRLGIVVASAQHNGQTWFFKMTGPDQLLQTQKDRFSEFIASLAFQGQ